MKKEQDNIDKLFKRGLDNPVDETSFMEDDWDALEQMLDGNKKRRGIVFWLPILSSVAALLLLIWGWWMFRPQVKDEKQQQQITLNHQPQKTPVAKGSVNDNTRQAATVKPEKAMVAANTNTVGSAIPVNHKTTGIGEPDNKIGVNGDAIIKNDNETIAATPTIPGQITLTAASEGANKTGGTTTDSIPVIASVNIVPQTPASDNAPVATTKPDKATIKKTGLPFHPQYAISVIASPELNGVNSLQQNTAGSNFGLLFSAEVFKKFTVSTGASYSTKPYATGFANYHTSYQFKTNPQSITADCRVLDIPINVDYQLYSKHSNKISIGTGLSSYIMMHESYEYNYADAANAGPEYFNVKNPNKYLFSILNLQATYQRQINSKVGISIQPYMKLPLSTIGASQVRLQTAGMAVGLNWNINSRTKP